MDYLQLLAARTFTVTLAPIFITAHFELFRTVTCPHAPLGCPHSPRSQRYLYQTLNRFTCLVYSHRFVSKQELEDYNQTIYTCIFISKKLQDNPILICIVYFLSGPQGPALLCKPWNFIWTWTLGQHVGYSTTSND